MEVDVDIKIREQRYEILDSIRGLVLISMILYHACWDLVYIFGKDFRWYQGTGAYIWQQSICWTFIFLSGFCWSLGRNPIKRGMTVFISGAVVSLVTIVFMPEDRVVFGVLTLIGSCMLIMVPLKKVLSLSSGSGFLLSVTLFVLFRNINRGYLGFEKWNLVELPDFLYQGKIMTFLGFTEHGFYSTDYFSVFPWFFLFLSGYFLYCMIGEKNDRQIMNRYFAEGFQPLSFLGRHSLIIYMLHQPFIYGIFVILQKFQLL